MSILTGQLNALSPLRVLARGYGLVQSTANEKTLRSVALVRPGDQIDVTMIDGTLRCDVQQIIDRRIKAKDE